MMDAVTTPGELAFLRGGGEIAQLIRDFEWGQTSLGPIEQWPQIVRSTCALILRSPVPIVTLWGARGVMLYNDAYGQFAGARHPDILGKDVLDAWPEAADWNRKVMDTVFHRGETLTTTDMELVLYRHGVGESVWLNLDYSAIPDDDGFTAGVMAIVVDTTDKVRAQRRLSGERERLTRMFQQAPGFMALLEGPNHVFTMANAAYFELVGGRDVLGLPVAEALPEVAGQGFLTLLHNVYEKHEPYVGSAVPVILKRVGDTPEQRFVDFIYQPILQDGEISGIFVQGHDVTERKQFERHQQLLVGELNHRVKNTLAIVQSLTHQSFHSSVPPSEAIQRFEGRLQALAAAHNLLTRNSWEEASIEEVVSTGLAPFCPPDRCEVSGPDVRVSPQTAVSLALAVHELATNAAKYGALSNNAGRIAVRWTVQDQTLRLVWSESGGPPVTPPERRGFGTRMIERTLAAEFGGTVELDFASTGLTCTVVAPVPLLHS